MLPAQCAELSAARLDRSGVARAVWTTGAGAGARAPRVAGRRLGRTRHAGPGRRLRVPRPAVLFADAVDHRRSARRRAAFVQPGHDQRRRRCVRGLGGVLARCNAYPPPRADSVVGTRLRGEPVRAVRAGRRLRALPVRRGRRGRGLCPAHAVQSQPPGRAGKPRPWPRHQPLCRRGVGPAAARHAPARRPWRPVWHARRAGDRLRAPRHFGGGDDRETAA